MSRVSHGFAIFARVFMIKFVALTLFAILAIELRAGEREVVARDLEGNGVEDVVVFADALAKEEVRPLPQAGTKKLGQVTITQRNKEFEPYVTPIQVRTTVGFPNEDDTLHNVYSFSEAKKFHLPLYKDSPPDPVTFDKPGAVILGCNIHDWMMAYVYVVYGEGYITVPICATLCATWNGCMQETDLFAKTRRECVPTDSVAASLLLTVLANKSVSRTVSDPRQNIHIDRLREVI